MDAPRQTHQLIRRNRRAAFAVFAAVLIQNGFQGCAHVEAPPGGPVDTTPPTVTAVFPAPGAHDVPRDAAPTFRFSEWIDREAGRGRVLISPPLRGRPKTVVDGDKFIFHPPGGSFSPNTAYRITLLASLKDLHGVAMGRSFSLAFTTGGGFDSGAVSGRVLSADRHAAAFVALYRKSILDSAWFPAFVTPADSLGSFAFDSVSRGKYAVVAFADLNGNLTPDPGFEPMAIGPADLALDPRAPAQSLRLATIDTTPMRVKSAKFGLDTARGDTILGSVRVQFIRPALPGEARLPAHYHVRNSKGDSLSVQGVGWDAQTGEWVVETGPFLRGERCELRVDGIADFSGNGEPPGDSSEFKVDSTGRDSTAWMLGFENSADESGMVSMRPSMDLLPAAEFLLRSSRILTADRWSQLEKGLEVRIDTLLVKPKLRRLGPTELAMGFADTVGPGKNLRLRLHPTPPDSVFKTLLSGQTAELPRLGEIHFQVPPSWKGWTFFVQGGVPAGNTIVNPVTEDSVTIRPLTAGKYKVVAFLDANHDGLWQPGSLRPWTAQEPFAAISDSLQVTAGAVTVLTLPAR